MDAAAEASMETRTAAQAGEGLVIMPWTHGRKPEDQGDRQQVKRLGGIGPRVRYVTERPSGRAAAYE